MHGGDRASQSAKRAKTSAGKGETEKKAVPEKAVAKKSPPKEKKEQNSSYSSEEEEVEEELPEEEPSEKTAPELEKCKKAEAEKLEAQVAIAGRVDDLGAKAVAFSKALVRGTQALRTAARIAREAAMSFESEMENFIQAQRDINRTFNIPDWVQLRGDRQIPPKAVTKKFEWKKTSDGKLAEVRLF